MSTGTKRRPVVYRVPKATVADSPAAKATANWEIVKEDVTTEEMRVALKNAQWRNRGYAEGTVKVDLWGNGLEEVPWRATIGDVRREMDDRGERGGEFVRHMYRDPSWDTKSLTGGTVVTEGDARCYRCKDDIVDPANHKIVHGPGGKLVDVHKDCNP